MDLILSAQQKAKHKRKCQCPTFPLFHLLSWDLRKPGKHFLFSIGTFKAPWGCPERRAPPAVRLLSSSNAQTIHPGGLC